MQARHASLVVQHVDDRRQEGAEAVVLHRGSPVDCDRLALPKALRFSNSPEPSAGRPSR